MTQRNFIRGTGESPPFDTAVFYDKFGGTGPEDPTENWWSNSNPSEWRVENNALTFSSSTAGEFDQITSRFEMDGNFDIQIDWDVDLPVPLTSTNYFRLSAYVDGSSTDRVMLIRQRTTTDNYITLAQVVDGVFQPSVDFTTTVTTGKFRIVKINTSLYAYYDIGSSWVQIGGTMDYPAITDGRALVILPALANNPTFEVRLTNFVINSCDRIVWPGGTLKYHDGSRWVPVYMNRNISYTTETSYLDTFDTLNTTIWASTPSDVSILNGKLRFDPVDGTGANRYAPQFVPTVSGDFDIRVDFDEISNTYAGITGGSNSVGMLINVTGSGVVTLAQYAHNTSGGRRYYIWSDTGGTNIQYSTSHTSGKLRLTRVSGAIKAYIWTGTQWEWNGNTSGQSIKTGWTGDLSQLILTFFQGTNGTYVVDADNFQVTADTITWNGAGYWTDSILNRYDTGTWNYVGTNELAPIPSASQYFRDTFNGTGGSLMTAHTPNTAPAGGSYTALTYEAGTTADFQITLGGTYAELESNSGTVLAYSHYDFGESFYVNALDLQFQDAKYTVLGNAAVETNINDLVGFRSSSNAAKYYCIYPGGNILVDCVSHFDNAFYLKRVEYDGLEIRYYIDDILVYTHPYTATMKISSIKFRGRASTSGTRRAKWDDMSLYIHGLRP